jgi:predicted methyltransferase
MRNSRIVMLALLAAPIACTPPPEPVAPPPPAVVEAPKPPEPTAEEKKKAEEDKKKADAAAKLAADRAEWETEAKAEAARWTPAMRAEAKKLAGARYASLKAGVEAARKGTHRKPVSAARDQYRHPLETLEFFGLKPTMTVLEWGPGEGWYTELLAPTLASKGKLIVNTGDPKGPASERSTFYAERLAGFLDNAPEVYGKVERALVPKPIKMPMEGTVDMIIVCRGLHGMHRDKVMTGFLGEAFKALKPGGVLGVEQHRAKADANPDEIAKKGYLPEAFVVAQIEAAGFKLAGKSEINANPKDTTDYPEGVWTLPPTLELKDKDRQKYLDIGESDRMTLRFVKPKK